MSGVVDLTAAGDTEISLPTGARFYPNEVGIVITEADSVTGQPSLSFGEGSASPATLSASAQTTGLDVVGDRERRQTLNKDVGVTVLSATVDTAATATTLTGRVYFQGLFVEDE
jgi:hypothetical protein